MSPPKPRPVAVVNARRAKLTIEFLDGETVVFETLLFIRKDDEAHFWHPVGHRDHPSTQYWEISGRSIDKINFTQRSK